MAETLKEMMSAYVAGCLDNANLVQFLDYIDNGGEINKDELGELQNVAALIPIILEDEAPPASLQNKIFQQIPDNEAPQKIITKTKKAHLREILESKKKEVEKESSPEDIEIEVPEEVSFKSASKREKKEVKEEDHTIESGTAVPETPASDFDVEPESKVTVKTTVKEELPEEDTNKPHAEEEPIFAPKAEKKKKEKVTVPRDEESESFSHVTVKKTVRTTMIVPPGDKVIEDNERSPAPVEECEEGNGSFFNTLSAKIVTAVSILVAVILLILYFSTKSNLTEKVTTLQKEKTVLQSEVNSKNDFIASNLPLIESFNQKDLIVVPLAGTADQGSYDARVLLSPSSRMGVLQFLRIPKISDKESLQLWLISKGQSYSVGVFHPKEGQKFYPLNKIPHIPFEEIEMFRMTKEPASGSEFPSGSTVYFGAFPVK